MKNKKHTIFFNGRFLAQPKTGVQRFAEELLTELDHLAEADEYSDYQFICLTPPEKEALRLPDWKNIHLKSCGRLKGNLWEQIDLPYHARRGLLVNLCNIGPVLHPGQIAVIHDASVFAIPEAYSAAFRLKYKFIFFILARTARQIITVSHFSKKELNHYLRIPENKIKVLSEGCEHILRVQADPFTLKKFALQPHSFFLAVGSASRHKNIHAVVEAMQKSEPRLPKLVIAGGSFTKVFRSEESVPDDKLIRPGYVTDAQLRSLYENALAFVFPSLYEGFGIPPLEAMSCGCPVISSGSASLPEVCGNAALYVDPTDIEQIHSALQQLAESPTLRNDLKEKGLEQARKFTWKKTASEFLQILMQQNY